MGYAVGKLGSFVPEKEMRGGITRLFTKERDKQARKKGKEKRQKWKIPSDMDLRGDVFLGVLVLRRDDNRRGGKFLRGRGEDLLSRPRVAMSSTKVGDAVIAGMGGKGCRCLRRPEREGGGGRGLKYTAPITHQR